MEFPHVLAALRQSRGLSQTRLAELLNESSGRITMTRSEISRWERGARVPSTYWLKWLAGALDVTLEQLEQAKVTGELLPRDTLSGISSLATGTERIADRLSYLDARSVLESPWTPAGTVAAIVAVARGAAMDRRDFLIATGSALTAHALGWADTLHEVSAASNRGKRRLGLASAANIEQRIDELRHLEDELGSEDLRTLAVSEYKFVSHLADTCSYSDAVGRRLFTALADVARMCGYIHFDTGRHASAQQFYLGALRASSMAGNATVGANALASMAIQTYIKGNPHDAVNLIQTALDQATAATPRVRAMLHARSARALAKAGDRQASIRALDAARDAFAAGSHDDDPAWVYWFDAREVETHSASCALDLGDADRALEFYGSARTLAGDMGLSHARDNLLWLTREAKAHLALGDADAACATAGQAVQENTLLNSARSTDELADFRSKLLPYRDTAAAREFLSLA